MAGSHFPGTHIWISPHPFNGVLRYLKFKLTVSYMDLPMKKKAFAKTR
jgi:hypothetical protein